MLLTRCRANRKLPCNVDTATDMLKTFNSGFIGGDGGAFNSHVVLLGGQGRVDGDLVVSLVTVWQTQVKILQLNVDIGQDELKDQSREK